MKLGCQPKGTGGLISIVSQKPSVPYDKCVGVPISRRGLLREYELSGGPSFEALVHSVQPEQCQMPQI